MRNQWLHVLLIMGSWGWTVGQLQFSELEQINQLVLRDRESQALIGALLECRPGLDLLAVKEACFEVGDPSLQVRAFRAIIACCLIDQITGEPAECRKIVSLRPGAVSEEDLMSCLDTIHRENNELYHTATIKQSTLCLVLMMDANDKLEETAFQSLRRLTDDASSRFKEKMKELTSWSEKQLEMANSIHRSNDLLKKTIVEEKQISDSKYKRLQENIGNTLELIKTRETESSLEKGGYLEMVLSNELYLLIWIGLFLLKVFSGGQWQRFIAELAKPLLLSSLINMALESPLASSLGLQLVLSHWTLSKLSLAIKSLNFIFLLNSFKHILSSRQETDRLTSLRDTKLKLEKIYSERLERRSWEDGRIRCVDRAL